MVGVTRFERSGAKRSDGIAIADRGWRDMEISRHDRVTISNSLVTESRGKSRPRKGERKKRKACLNVFLFSCPKMGGSAMVGVTRFERSGAKRSDGIAIADRGWRDMEISRHDRVTISNSLVTESRGKSRPRKGERKKRKACLNVFLFFLPQNGRLCNGRSD